MLQARSPSSALQFEVEALRGVLMSVVEVWLTPSVQCPSCWTCSSSSDCKITEVFVFLESGRPADGFLIEMASAGLVLCPLSGARLLTRASASLSSVHATSKFQAQQQRGIISKALREPGYSRPAPFPYKKKTYNIWRALFDDTTQRFDENSKIVVIDGPPTGNKTKFAKQIAEELDMHYIPAPSMDAIYVNKYGFDRRTLNKEVPLVFRSVDIEDFLRRPNHSKTTLLQFYLMHIRFAQYQDAISHLLNTGQGVVMHRSIYSDPVFMKTLVDVGYSNDNALKYYLDCMDQGMWEFLRPHLIIYLDIPVDKIIANVKARNKPEEVNSKFFTPEVLTSLEKNYKNYLRTMGEHAELLMYDWSEEGDAEVVVEDICRINFDKYTKYDQRLSDWIFNDEWDWKAKRIMFSAHPDKMLLWLDVPKLCVPELIASGDEWHKFDIVMEKSPGNKYDYGFNKMMGDNILFKA
ncbi:Deoxynucleoside kinase domain [Trinorchestia longiramus]|nr:Deoxynucleoside kinase domain [Trinorchestia longiramus]